MTSVLTAVTIAVLFSSAASGVEGTVYLPDPTPDLLSLRLREAPSDADSPVDWRRGPASAPTARPGASVL